MMNLLQHLLLSLLTFTHQLALTISQVTAEVFIVGCEPSDFGDDLEGRMGLSEPVAAAIPGTIHLLRDLVAQLQESDVPTSVAV